MRGASGADRGRREGSELVLVLCHDATMGGRGREIPGVGWVGRSREREKKTGRISFTGTNGRGSCVVKRREG
jgi:hypothetical protein